MSTDPVLASALATPPRSPAPPEWFTNRELSWLGFNRRVLEEARDSRNPLLERMKFLAIFDSSLSEFFEVRVAGLRHQAQAGVAERDADGLSMVTMYSAVANRTAEIGTLRALGFRRRSILVAFLIESLLLGLLGGIVGLLCASFMQWITISTGNFETFAELAFSFSLSYDIVYKGLTFALIMGFVGGVLPAFKAARMKIVDALRAS